MGYDFLHDPFQVLLIWNGGLVMYGGLFGALLLGVVGARRHQLNPWNAVDTGLVAGFVGLAVGRWGCFLVGDDYGSVVGEAYRDLPFPITLEVPSLAWLNAHPESLFDHALAGEVLWATQIWMSANAVLAALLGWWILRRRRWVGQAAAGMLVYYALSRFTIEIFRGDEIRGVWFGGALSTSQLVSIVGLILGVALLVRKPGPDVAEAPA